MILSQYLAPSRAVNARSAKCIRSAATDNGELMTLVTGNLVSGGVS